MEIWEELRAIGDEINRLPSEKTIIVNQLIVTNSTTIDSRQDRDYESDAYRKRTSVNS